jgi:hypothetical protein
MQVLAIVQFPTRLLHLVVAALLLATGTTQRAFAQTVTVSGVVRDAASAQPVIGAVITLGVGDGARSTRTDETGSFVFARVIAGNYLLAVRRLGYQPATQPADVRAGMQPIAITVDRVASLDTVRIRATAQGIYGAVGTSHDLRPLPAAEVQVVGVSRKLQIDSTGHFFAAIRTPGVYIVRATLPGYAPQTVSVTVRHDEGVEVALLLDSATGPVSHALQSAFADFNSRILMRRNSSAIIPRSELTQGGDHQLLDAVRRSRSFLNVGIRIGQTACVFVNGEPRPGVSLNAFDPAEVEAVEAYTPGSEPSGTLGRRWPHGVPCADTGMPSVSGGRDVVQWMVIWLKQ